MGAWFNARFPNIAQWLLNRALKWKFERDHPNYNPAWGFFPAPPLVSSPGQVNDRILGLMAEGKVHNLFGVLRFTPTGVVTSSVSLADTQAKEVRELETEADIVIFSTACDFDYSFLSPEADPTHYAQPEWEALQHKTNNLKFPRLYQTLFHLDHPNSLAFIGPCRGFSVAAFSNTDLASQAIAQVWKGNHPLPAKRDMEAWCDEVYQTSLSHVRRWRIGKIGADPLKLERWMDEAAGTRVNEHLGWGWSGWKFWWSDRKLFRLCLDGVNSAHVYRLFEGRAGARERWEGAREAIFRANGRANGRAA